MDQSQQGQQQDTKSELTRGTIEPSSQQWENLSKEEQQTYGSRENFERQYPKQEDSQTG